MSIDKLAHATLDELERIKRKNLLFFNSLVVFDLCIFYFSLFTEHWVLLFLSFGMFVAGIALYDNYRISKEMIDARSRY